ncbi:hypothetical protein [Ruegeria sp.]|uniref:hypothetical protein n=1 Tax=Ruegeria sp. TaxID=1879320 RepID=UPI003AFFC569
MIRGIAYPGAKAFPRRPRRGLSALTGVMLLASVMAGIAASWQIDIARARIEGEARHLAEVVAAEGYGLHHWLHANPPITAPGTDPCQATGAAPCGRALTSEEQARLARAATIAPWRRDATDTANDPTRVLLARGWTLTHLIGDTGNGPADGVIVLHPGMHVVTHPTWRAARQALDNAFGLDGAGDEETQRAAALIARDALGRGFDPKHDRAILASRFARLDTQALFRERVAGHPPLPMTTGINMGGRTILGTGRLGALSATVPTLRGQGDNPLRADRLAPQAGMTLNGVFAPRIVTLSGTGTAQIDADATVTETLRVGTNLITGLATQSGAATITGRTTARTLIACADPDAELCGGGDLEIRRLKPDQTLADVVVFGTTTVTRADTRAVTTTGGAETSTVRETRAGTGVFDEITRPRLRVTGCYRSVTPFVYGSRC